MNQEEILENTEMQETETLVEVDYSVELLTQIRDDVRVIVAFTIITFVMSCLRGWRKNAVKGVR